MRILVLSDTHLGIDLPSRPRVPRRRRGDDFFEGFEHALSPAFRGEADLVLHAGDLFYRSRIPAWLAARVFGRLADLADAGVDLFLVPGNHERGAIPRSLLLTHPRVRFFDVPRTYRVSRDGVEIALAGFPHTAPIRGAFRDLVAATRALETHADVRLLCIHQLVEGTRVGPSGYTFRDGEDVVRGQDVPEGFAAVVCGHVHRHQVLDRDPSGRPLACPVVVPGSIDRTSFAERLETKGYLVLDAAPGPLPGGTLLRVDFREIPTRPMAEVELRVDGLPREALALLLREALSPLDPASIVRIHLLGTPAPGALAALGAEELRAAAPPTMNVALAGRPAGEPR